MSQVLAEKFSPAALLRFALPSMIMMGFMSLYTIVDGIFISRFVGSHALSAINLVYPVFNLQLGVGIMLATGGSAVVSKRLGEGRAADARQAFSMVVVSGLLVSAVLMLLTVAAASPLSLLLGATDELLPDCRTYLCVLMFFAPACTLQSLYQSFFVTAGKPSLGLGLIIGAGIANVALDYLFVAVLGWGVAGAALATGIGQAIPAMVGTIFFFGHKKELRFCKFRFHGRTLFRACTNGSSEMVTQLSNAVITILFNLILMHMAGADGVAAITIILYGQFLFSSLYQGFSIGVAPIFGYQYGSGNFPELHRLHRICSRFILGSSLLVTLLSLAGSPYIVEAFVPSGSATCELAVRGFFLFSFCYLFCGMNIYSSGLFTALSDGKHSAILSFSRTFLFLLAALLLLPLILGIDGVWLAVPAAELLTFFLAVYLDRQKLP